MSVRKVAAHFDVSTQSVYGWEAGGADFVDDNRATGLATVLEMDLLEVRRGLGLWVPPPEPEETLPFNPTDDELDEMIAEARKDRDRGNPELYDALMSVWRLRHPEQHETGETA